MPPGHCARAAGHGQLSIYLPDRVSLSYRPLQHVKNYFFPRAARDYLTIKWHKACYCILYAAERAYAISMPVLASAAWHRMCIRLQYLYLLALSTKLNLAQFLQGKGRGHAPLGIDKGVGYGISLYDMVSR